MVYRDYGQTGKKVSLLGFGGMRFSHIDDQEECVRAMVIAAEGGVNYFDTAPGYFQGKSEEVFGKGLAELRGRGLPYYLSTKTFATNESEIRREIEAQLKRMDVPAIDFYHVWCVTSLDNWRGRKDDGILQALINLKEDGLIRHICVSSHLVGDEIQELLTHRVFEGVLLGYSAYNFQTRQAALGIIRENNLGLAIMNPLGGGIIPQHPDRFAFLRRGNEGTVAAALHFLWDHPEISVTLVGVGIPAHMEEALAAMESYQARSAVELAEVKARASASLEGICTGCAYCDNCPEGIPIPKFMDAYNQKILIPSGDPIGQRLRVHWRIDPAIAGTCIACGECEKACTQHLNIIERLKEIAG